MQDTKSQIKVIQGHAPASRSGASLVGSTAVNIGDYLSGTFAVNVGTLATGRTLAGKLQYSATSNFASATDDDGSTGNTAAVTTLAAGVNLFHIVQPVDPDKPYYRVACTDAGGAIVYGSVFLGKAKVTPVTY